MCLVMFLYPFGSCIAYLVIIGDSFQPLLLAAFGSAWWTGRSAVIAGVSLTCVLPLCFPTRLGALKGKSALPATAGLPCCATNAFNQFLSLFKPYPLTYRVLLYLSCCALLLSAAVSSACVSGLMVVVGAVVYRSVQIVLAPDYSWAPVRAFNPSPSFLSALPLIIFAFHVSALA
jgi:amino acid permease